jgi:hypothetical protein
MKSMIFASGKNAAAIKAVAPVPETIDGEPTANPGVAFEPKKIPVYIHPKSQDFSTSSTLPQPLAPNDTTEQGQYIVLADVNNTTSVLVGSPGACSFPLVAGASVSIGSPNDPKRRVRLCDIYFASGTAGTSVTVHTIVSG